MKQTLIVAQAFNIGDFATTYIGLSMGGQDLNPFITGIESLIVIKILASIILMALYIGRYDIVFRNVLKILAACLFMVTIWNLSVISPVF